MTFTLLAYGSSDCKNSKTRQWLCALLLAAGCSLIFAGFPPSARSASQAVSAEYQVKAAFLVKFLKYMQWDLATNGNNTDEIIIGVMGETPLWEALSLYEGKMVANHIVRLRKVSGISDMTGCRIVYLSVTEKRSLPQFLEHAAIKRILTISDIKRFAHAGGGIGFIPRGDTIQFEINNRAAQAVGVQISSHLLHLAARVIN